MPNLYKKCIECGREFYFKEADQKFYQEQGFVEPKRCFYCRQKRKEEKLAQGVADPAAKTDKPE